jgi:xanthine dehydrogenase YagR molybdenum-binding subunit
MMFNNPVRYAGEAVAVVAAVDRYIAEDALELIEVQYEPLPFVLDANRALDEGAPEIHDEGNSRPTTRRRTQRGDLAAGFAEADVIVEETYRSQYSNNAQMEPRVSVAKWEGRNLTVWTTTQGVSNARSDIAREPGPAPEQRAGHLPVRRRGLRQQEPSQDYDLMAAFLAKMTGRPVRLEYTRQDDWVSLHGRWSTEMQYRAGARRDGTLTAIDFRAVSNMGAYMKSHGNISNFELYACPNVRAEITRVFTNRITSANQRALRRRRATSQSSRRSTSSATSSESILWRCG